MHCKALLVALFTIATASASNLWDHIADTNIFKTIYLHKKHVHRALIEELEKFYQAAQVAGTTAQEELHAIEQLRSQTPLTLEILDNDDEEDIGIILEHGLRSTILQSALESELDRLARTMTLKEDDIAEALWLAPLIIFAAYAGSTQREQRFIFSVLTGYLAAAQQDAAQQRR